MILQSCQQFVRVLICLYTCQHICIFNFSHPSGYEMVSYYVFHVFLLMTNDVEHLFHVFIDYLYIFFAEVTIYSTT